MSDAPRPAAATPPITRSELVIAAILAVAAAAVRIAALLLWPPDGLTGDEYDYVELAAAWACTGAFDNLGRSPGYPWFLGLFYLLPVADPLRAAQLGQIALAALSTTLIWLIGRSELSPRAGLAAAALFALDPTLVGYSHYFFTESLYILLLLLAAATWLRALRGGGWVWTAVTGLVMGYATLVKGTTQPHLAALAAWALLARPPRAPRLPNRWLAGAAHAALLLASAAAVILPWSFSLYRRHGQFVLVDASDARTLWHANRLECVPCYDWGVTPERLKQAERRWRVKAPSLTHETVDSAAAMRAQELQFIRHNALLILRRVPAKLAALWNPTNFVQRRIARGQMLNAPRASPAGQIIGIGSAVFYAATLFAGVVGLWHARPGRLRTFVLLLLVLHCGVYAIMCSTSRYRVPLMPFVFLYAGAALAHLRPAPARPPGAAGRTAAADPSADSDLPPLVTRGRWRMGAAAATILLLASSWWPYRAYALMQIDEPARIRRPAPQTPSAT